MRGSASTLPPTFLFLQYSIFKEQTSQTRCRGPVRFWLRARSSVAHAALLISYHKGELLCRQRRAALVGEAYIVGAPPKCQQAIRTFLNFLRQRAVLRTLRQPFGCPYIEWRATDRDPAAPLSAAGFAADRRCRPERRGPECDNAFGAPLHIARVPTSRGEPCHAASGRFAKQRNLRSNRAQLPPQCGRMSGSPEGGAGRASGFGRQYDLRETRGSKRHLPASLTSPAATGKCCGGNEETTSRRRRGTPPY